MAKKRRKATKRKTTRRKTTAKAVVRINPKRKRRRVRRNPSKTLVNSLIFYGIGGFAGVEAPKMINRFAPVKLPLGISSGDIGTMALAYMLMKSRKVAVKDIGTAMFATSAGLTIAKVIGSVSKGGLKGLEDIDLSGLEAGEYLADFDSNQLVPLSYANDYEDDYLEKNAI